MLLAPSVSATQARRSVPWLLLVLPLLGAGPDPFAQFDLPDAWEARFWGGPDVKALLALEPRAVPELVPVQAGLRYCRCPNCDATEADDTLAWSVLKPKVLTCRRCGITVPNDKVPARDEKEKKVPEDAVEVLPRVTHHYPYHEVPAETQSYPEERLYLDAKRDYEAREFLAKAALYAAVRHREQPAHAKDPNLARLACVLILRFAHVYPAYATHYDQPGQPKFFQQADLPPPYRRGYRTGKWDWTASLDVPLNLVIAYALLRDDPALAVAGRLLGDPNPARTIEHGLFRASAEFVRAQPEEYSEMSLHAYRGLLAVGRLLNDPALLREAEARLGGFSERGFYHDGFWRQGDVVAHRRVRDQLDGWIQRLLAGPESPPAVAAARPEVPMLALARLAESAIVTDPRTPEVQRASWPAPVTTRATRRPVLLGGAGVARLAVGDGADALDLELRGQDSVVAPHFQRLALRLAVGGQPVLGDLDDRPPTATGWDRATASHNTVMVDGLNQRESPPKAGEPTPGGHFLFFAADPDFQVVTLDDPLAYPQSATRYRQTLIAVAGGASCYGLGVFEVHGGLQHDQLFHAAAGSPARWQAGRALGPGPATLLPPSLVFLPTARAEDGRWFIQALGEFTPLGQAQVTRPTQAWLTDPTRRGIRLHLLGDTPLTMIAGVSPDPSVPRQEKRDDEGRAGLVLRRRSADGSTLKSTFVTLFEPVGRVPAPGRVGRIKSPPGTVVVFIETAEGPEHLVVNLDPGTERTVSLADGRSLTTDGLAVRVSREGLALAGGTFAESSGQHVRQQPASGRIKRVVRQVSAGSRGWFEVEGTLSDASHLAGRVVLVRHGDGTSHGWTVQRAEGGPEGARLHVVEEPGFLIDHATGAAHYYQFPRTVAPGPHQFRVARIAR